MRPKEAAEKKAWNNIGENETILQCLSKQILEYFYSMKMVLSQKAGYTPEDSSQHFF